MPANRKALTTLAKTAPLALAFAEGVSVEEHPDGNTMLASRTATVSLARCSPGLQAVLGRLATDGAQEEELLDEAVALDGPAGLPKVVYYLQRFRQRGLIHSLVRCDGSTLMTIIPMSAAYTGRPVLLDAGARYRLSRFACFRRDKSHLVLESPLVPARFLLHDARVTTLLHALIHPQPMNVLARLVPDLPEEVKATLLGVWLAGNVLYEPDPNTGPDDEEHKLAQWTFHDLLFHTRSRRGRHGYPMGSTYRFLGKTPPLPAVKPPMSDETIDLYKPDLHALREEDRPFTWVLEERRSRRTYGEKPITATQLGEFLYRTARVRALRTKENVPYEYSDRPYPGGGACYELELYVVAHACNGLPAGLYHYAPLRHHLEKLTGRTPEVEILLQQASTSAGQQEMPQLLIVLAARFQRMTWKYDAMAYAAILKHVGVLFQTMYLVATAMDLAACALGSGDADTFAIAAGTDYYTETSVGEFILGSRVDTP